MKRKLIFILIAIALFFAVGLVVMLLWNYLMPVIFGIKAITYLQALGLFLLSRILLGSLRFVNRKPSFANPKFKEKMMNMTNEERDQFKEEWKSRCNK